MLSSGKSRGVSARDGRQRPAAVASAGIPGATGAQLAGPLGTLRAIERTIWLTRPDLRAICGTSECGTAGCGTAGDDFDLWLRVFGRQEYRALQELPQPAFPDALLDRVAAEALAGVQPVLTELMVRIWRLRRDLHKRFDIRSARGQRAFVWWLLTHGVRDTPGWAAIAERACRPLAEAPADRAIPGLQPPLTGLMQLAWTMRPDLQAAFDLATAAGQQDLAWWCFVHGPAELGLDRYLTEAQRRFLAEPDERFPQSPGLPVTRLMGRVWSTRRALQASYRLDRHDGRVRFGGWFYAHGMAELGLLGLIGRDLAAVLARPVGAAMPAPAILSLLWVGDEGIRRRFPDPRDPGLVAWGEGEAAEAVPVLRRLRALRAPAGPAAPAVLPARRPTTPGYNLIGYARGQFGIGEDVRMAALALKAAGVPYSIYNVEPGREVCQGDRSALADVSDALPYSTNLFCTTGIETARLAAVEGGRLFDGRRSIGLWPWELPDWPAEWRHAYDLVDEVWGASRFTAEAYRRSSPKPVRHMPMAVVADASAGLGRRDFRLPARRFLFAFSFDALSGYARKNPLACVAAFRAAFPQGSEPVGLVVKVMRARRGEPGWEAFREAARGDRRITVINRTLDRGAVLDLYRACDCFVSLHRAEGFGRGIAEAMLLGKPVIVTGWSGNMDFTTPETAALVEHRLVAVRDGDYPFAAGQSWADADTAHAAWWMRRIAGEPDLRARLAGQGRDAATKAYAPARVGALYGGTLGRLAA